MDLQCLQTFKEVAKQGSFTKAAEELGYVQSSVTAQIQKLEKECGVVLFERFGRRMRLTPSGEVLLQYATRILLLTEEAKQTVSSQTSGSIVIGTIETLAAFFLPPLLQRFRELYPQINVILQPGSEPAIIQAVREGECDVGLLLDRPYADPDLTCIAIREEPIVLLGPANTHHAQLQPLTLQDVAQQPLIVTEPSCTYRSALERELREQQMTYHFAYELGSIEAIKQCVIYGLGLGLLPAVAVREELENGKLKQLPFQLPDPPFYTQLIHHRKKWLSAPLTDFIRLLTAQSL
ncbi:LysR family transcriptional regulator [Paenibacillus cremeus]|uniref:LysR family transcriptional regulator n=1 Tax=Paenibacillus cremeus TaxID=2163881 RepID=A0A559JMG9_9BACL|nr:LysR family transcriptional regulator [Paenibacillus cremeus]TVY01069.1 LysR family transcriptional regulator [Paenibacillus cremeus]